MPNFPCGSRIGWPLIFVKKFSPCLKPGHSENIFTNYSNPKEIYNNKSFRLHYLAIPDIEIGSPQLFIKNFNNPIHVLLGKPCKTIVTLYPSTYFSKITTARARWSSSVRVRWRFTMPAASQSWAARPLT